MLKFNTIIPLIYALLPNKTKCTYKRLIVELKKLQPNIKPSSIMMDFEVALHNAFEELFENVRIRGCFFHFCQCVWRKIQNIYELRQNYVEDSQFALNVRQLLTLAFVPVKDVLTYFDELLMQQFYIDNVNVLQPLIDYFEDIHGLDVQIDMAREKNQCFV